MNPNLNAPVVHEFLTIKEAAKTLRFCETTIHRKCIQKKIRCVKVFGEYRIPKSAILEILEVDND